MLRTEMFSAELPVQEMAVYTYAPQHSCKHKFWGNSMKTTVRFLMLALITIAMPQLFRAQRGMMMQPPSIAGVFNPVVGSGASYEMVKGDNGEKTAFDMAVVEKDSSGGYWIEYAVQNATPMELCT